MLLPTNHNTENNESSSSSSSSSSNGYIVNAYSDLNEIYDYAVGAGGTTGTKNSEDRYFLLSHSQGHTFKNRLVAESNIEQEFV